MDQREEENIDIGEGANSPEMRTEFKCINLTLKKGGFLPLTMKEIHCFHMKG